MCSRLVFRSIQCHIPLLTCNRFLSLTQVQSFAATKLKEKSTSNVETSSTKIKSVEPASGDKTVNPSSTSVDTPDSNKTYSEKIHRLVNEISKLSLVDVMDLNELLKVNIQMFIRDFCFCFSIENAQDSRRADCGIGRRQWSTATGRTGTSNLFL
jgi:hypothetical protein